MLLRNMHIDPARSHCNGTCCIIRRISWQYITASIACGEYLGNVLLLPRNPLSLTDAGIVSLDNARSQLRETTNCSAGQH